MNIDNEGNISISIVPKDLAHDSHTNIEPYFEKCKHCGVEISRVVDEKSQEVLWIDSTHFFPALCSSPNQDKHEPEQIPSQK